MSKVDRAVCLPEQPMEALDYWRLCDEVSVVQAALLIVGEDPSQIQDYVDSNSPQNRPPGYDAVINALQNAIFAKRLPASIGYTGEDETQVSLHATLIGVENLKAWLKSKGITTGFFSHRTTWPRLSLGCSSKLFTEARCCDPSLESGIC